jgi:hypothetical protein
VEKWMPCRELGAGTFGVVRFEERVGQDGNAIKSCRAVKQLRKSWLDRNSDNYKKELLAMAKFSRSKVRRSTLSVLAYTNIMIQYTRDEIFVEFFGYFDT